jgi:transposase-like protein
MMNTVYTEGLGNRPFLVDTKVDVQYKNGGVRMERIPNAVYTKELREEAVKLVTEQGLTIPDVGRRLSIPKSTISYWVREEKKGKLSSLGSSKKTLTEKEMELAQVKRELAQVKMERDFLKKAAAYFAKEPLSGTRS